MYISTNLGGSLIFILNPYLHWRSMAAIAFVVSLTGLMQTFVLPESKYWYLLRGDKARAIRALKWYQPDCDKFETDRILCEISQTLRAARDKSTVGTSKFIKSVLTDWTYFKPILLGVAINLLRNGNGRAIFAVYFIDILHDLQIDSSVDADTLAYWYGIVSIASTVAILILIYKLSRKCVLYLSSTLIAASLLVVVARDPLLANFHLVLPSSLLVVCVYTYMLLVTTSYNSTISIVVSEIQIATHRAQTIAFHTGISYLFHCLYVFGYPYALEVIPINYILLIFVGNVVIGVVVFYAFVPETSKFEFYENDKRNDNLETDGKKERDSWAEDLHSFETPISNYGTL